MIDEIPNKVEPNLETIDTQTISTKSNNKRKSIYSSEQSSGDDGFIKRQKTDVDNQAPLTIPTAAKNTTI